LKFLRRRRRAISEVVGTVLTIGITLIAGAATWSFLRSQAGVTENTLQGNVLNTDNYLGEQFKVVDMTFPSTTSATVWIYNIGSLTMSPFQVRLYDSAGLINILYNYTTSGSTKTDRVFDIQASAANYHTTCRLAGSSYESPTISTTTVKTTNAQTITLTVPGVISGCPSYGQTLNSGTTYTVVVTGLYGNTYTFYQTR
jgi:flagellin-like protein